MQIPPPPPTLARDFLNGTQLVAGLGHSTVRPSLDFETYSEAGYDWDEDRQRWVQPRGATGVARGLQLVGTAVYAQHPSTEVLCLQYNLKDGRGKHLWIPGMPPPADLIDYLLAGGIVEAWNSAFEVWIWHEVCVRRYGWPPIPAHQFHCVMGRARAWGLPGKLKEAARVMGVAIQKDADGDRLLDKFSKPRNPTKKDPRRRLLPSEDPIDGPKLYAYCGTDIDAEDELAALIPDLEGDELAYWYVDQAVNRRGVHVDRASTENCAAIVDQVLDQYNGELRELTGGEVQSASEVQALIAWLAGFGFRVNSLDEDAVTVAFKDLGDLVQTGMWHEQEVAPLWRALEIRRACGLSSVKKVFAILLQLARGDRLHDLYSYHAARTGRPTGNGPQPTNLLKVGPKVSRCGWNGPKTQYGLGCGRYHAHALARCPWCGLEGPPGREPEEWCVGAARDALTAIATRNMHVVEAIFGNALQAVGGCLRGLFIADDDEQMLSSDYTAIEAVVIAALSGENWRLQVFRAKTDIYLESISRSRGMPVEELIAYKKTTGKHHPLRQGGKIQELALGFGGWINAVRSMALTIGIDLSDVSDDQLKADIIAWRNASPAIVEWWGGQQRGFGRVQEYFGLEGAAVQAILNPGQWQHVMRLDKTYCGVSYIVHEDVLYCRLPSDRKIAYHRPRLVQTGTWRGYKITFEGWNTNQKKGPPGWMTMDLYGGLQAENVTQAVARDVQRNAGINLERALLPVLLHVYDENVSGAKRGRTVEELEACMNALPEFATGWPISATGGWADDRYQKA